MTLAPARSDEQSFVDGTVGRSDLAAERDEYLEALQRVQAEFDNFKKRTARERSELTERAHAQLADRLLPVVDACEAAISHGASDVEPIYKTLLDVLEKEGLERMNAEGEPFDPTLHEAVMHEPGDEQRTGGDRDPSHGLLVEGPGVASGHGEGAGLSRWRLNASGSRRITTRSSASTRRRRRRTSPRRIASWRASCIPTRTPTTRRPRSDSRRSRRPTTSSVTTRSARSTTRSGASGPWPEAPGGFGGGAPGGGNFNFDGGDLSDLLGGLFGRNRGGGGAGAGYRGAGPQRGADLEAELHLPFREAVQGVTTSLHLTSDAPCSTCHGSGARPGTAPQVCPQCGGRGVLDENQGLFSFSTPCPNCGGRGAVITDPCPTCRGSGIERRPREVKVRIPAGVDDGQRIRLKGRGGPGRNGGPAGDLFVIAHVEPDPVFGRNGKNLTITVPVLFSEAALGTSSPSPPSTVNKSRSRSPRARRRARCSGSRVEV